MIFPPGVIRWGAMPVPYVAAWSSEETVHIATDPQLRQPALFRNGRRGLGKPLFGKMDESRQRLVVLRSLCQVCTCPLKGRGYVCDVPYSSVNGKPVINEPAACERCFRLTLALCPGVARMRDGKRPLIARVATYESMAVSVGPADGPDADEQLNAVLRAHGGGTVIGYVRPRLITYEVLDFADVRALSA